MSPSPPRPSTSTQVTQDDDGNRSDCDCPICLSKNYGEAKRVTKRTKKKHKELYPDEPTTGTNRTLPSTSGHVALDSLLVEHPPAPLATYTSRHTRLRSENVVDDPRKRNKTNEQATSVEERREAVEEDQGTDEDSDMPLDAVEYSEDSYLRAPTAELNVEVLSPDDQFFAFEELDPDFDEENNQWGRDLDADELAPEEDEEEADQSVDADELPQTPPEPLGDDDDVANYELPLEPPVERAPTPPPPPPLEDRPAQPMSWWTEQDVDNLHEHTTIVEAKEAMAYVKLLQEASIDNNHHALSLAARHRLRNPPRTLVDLRANQGLRVSLRHALVGDTQRSYLAHCAITADEVPGLDTYSIYRADQAIKELSGVEGMRSDMSECKSVAMYQMPLVPLLPEKI
ncbi:hypothetical protein CONPUDRAFT_68618 [Coniophora puteana RWD-64-598 SS2]|uniref:Uncharacterized protein n=1 Tax=Coniophora puteana (strain RWD-64-598) TaxID=741705 RepID=A0A5M3N3Q9_CONPW|nr:uncharacterized protein CONPUDRAFT_68618 [Coniophora puteana RWD-64-598 SS2]EIW85986.1 hypothetical protein CONPUDRAFT_68618 [Coniophora puteana RWD-64-598 SS2]